MPRPLARIPRAAPLAIGLLLALATLPGAARAEGVPVLKPPEDPAGPARPGGPIEAVLIRAAPPYDALEAAIRSAGGTVTRRYRHFGGVAALVPRSGLAAVGAAAGSGAISKDLRLRLPGAVDPAPERDGGPARREGAADVAFEAAPAVGNAQAIAARAAAHPGAYLINGGVLGIAALHAEGYTGEGVVVGVIDSGLRPGYPHLDGDGSILGGTDFVGDGLSAVSSLNAGHGTFVAGMISANADLTFGLFSGFVAAVRRYAPEAIVGTSTIPMIGTAPLAKIYALRVFGPLGDAPTSTLLAALDGAIDLRDAWDRGEPGGVDLEVVNVSLSTPTLYAGRDLLDTAVEALLDHDIVVVDSAGNAGPSGLTIGSPASSVASLAVGAASLAVNERILMELQYGAEFGVRFRPFAGAETAYFSSRGPVADGRIDPGAVANGVACYGMGLGSPQVINLATGTSFSAPSVAGVAAVLRQAFPGATARQIRGAILASADPHFLADGPTPEDQGRGMVDARAAFDLLAADAVPDARPALPTAVKSVAANVSREAGLDIWSGPIATHVGPLLPGQRAEFLYAITPNLRRVAITLSHVTPLEPPSGQNPVYGDGLFLAVHSAKTSRHRTEFGGEGDYLAQAFTRDGAFTVDTVETGLVRITVLGDWINAGAIEGDLAIVPESEATPQTTAQGWIVEHQTVEIPIEVPPGTHRADFRLAWREDWGRYPLNDLDLMVIEPGGGMFVGAATLDDPETMTLFEPPPGIWRLLIDGFELHTPDERYKLRVSLDGRVAR